MKFKKILLNLFFIGLFLAISANQSIASYAITEGKLDWEHMVLTGNISWTSKYTQTNAYVENDLTSDNKTDTQNGWVESTSSVSITEAQATGLASSTVLSATTSVGPYGQISPYADSTSNRWGDFTYTGTSPGYVTVSIPFTLSFKISASSDPGAFAYGFISVWGDLFRGADSGGGTHFYQYLEDYAIDGQTIEDSISGTLYLKKMFYPGDIGNLDVGVYTNSSAYSAIPIPTPIILLGSGLLGLVGLGKLKKLI